MPGFEVGSWYGFHAPAGTPQPIIVKLHAEMAKALGTPEMRERLRNVGADVVASTPAGYTEFVLAEMKKWEAVIRATGVKVE
jgi:tripartite-type tricarboxylate transporter receptor subunit TctC